MHKVHGRHQVRHKLFTGLTKKSFIKPNGVLDLSNDEESSISSRRLNVKSILRKGESKLKRFVCHKKKNG